MMRRGRRRRELLGGLALLGAISGSLQGCQQDNVKLVAGSCAAYSSEEHCTREVMCTWAQPSACGDTPFPCDECDEGLRECMGATETDNNDTEQLSKDQQECCNRHRGCFEIPAKGFGMMNGLGNLTFIGSTPPSGEAEEDGASFAAGTLVQAADGSWRRVEEVRLGEQLALGGTVTGRMEFFVSKEELFVYRAPGATAVDPIIVAASHAVLEGSVWRRVRDARGAVPVDDNLWNSLLLKGERRVRLYDLDVERHRLLVRGAPTEEGRAKLADDASTVFADFSEVDVESPVVQSFEASLLALLQAEQDAKVEV